MTGARRSDMEHDAKLAALYSVAADDNPPPHLDGAIRAAARSAIAGDARKLYSGSWRVPLAAAAVVLLSASLVAVMREQATDYEQPPTADSLALQTPTDQNPGGLALSENSAIAVPKTLARPQEGSQSVGLKPPRQTSPLGFGIGGRPGSSIPPNPRKKDSSEVATAPAPVGPAGQHNSSEPFSGLVAKNESKLGPPAERARQDAEPEKRGNLPPAAQSEQSFRLAMPTRQADPAASKSRVADETSAPPSGAAAKGEPLISATPRTAPSSTIAPAAPVLRDRSSENASPVIAERDSTPRQWLEKIEELRQRGQLEAAKASLADFRKRYPAYELPLSLKDGIKP